MLTYEQGGGEWACSPWVTAPRKVVGVRVIHEDGRHGGGFIVRERRHGSAGGEGLYGLGVGRQSIGECEGEWGVMNPACRAAGGGNSTAAAAP